jgi:hypothetical protein
MPPPTDAAETRGFLDRLLSRAPRRDASAVDVEAPEPVLAAGIDADAAPRAPGPPVRAPETVLREALATKLLDAWLQNRLQTLYPLTLNLRVLGPEARGLLVQLAAGSAAMVWDGGADRGRLLAALATAGGGEEEVRLLDRALAEPAPLPPLLEALRQAGLGAHAYAAGLLVLGRSGAVERAWLDFLAARLGLPGTITADLERRAGGGAGGRARRRR